MIAFVTGTSVTYSHHAAGQFSSSTAISPRHGTAFISAPRVRTKLCMAASPSAATDVTTVPDGETNAEWPSAQRISSGETPRPLVQLDIEGIMRILPHRFPFLLLDRVIAYEPGKRAIGIKSVTVNEPFFPGHFPARPIMPGVLQVEALAQLGGIVMLQPPFIDKDSADVEFFFGGVDKVKWRKPVVPGDTLVMEMTLTSFKESFGIAKMEGRYVQTITSLSVDGASKVVVYFHTDKLCCVFERQFALFTEHMLMGKSQSKVSLHWLWLEGKSKTKVRLGILTRVSTGFAFVPSLLECLRFRIETVNNFNSYKTFCSQTRSSKSSCPK